jgi:hypothetical protein
MKKVLLAAALITLLFTFAGCKTSDRLAGINQMAAVQVQNISVGNHTNYDGGGTTGGTHTGTTGGTYTGTGSSVGGSSPMGVVGTIFVIIIVIIVFAVRKGKGSGTGGSDSAGSLNVPPLNPISQDDIISQIMEHDPNFASEKFLSWSKQVFVQLQEAWQERNWKKVRPFESEELFNLHKGQLDEFIKNGTINMMENVCVNEAYLYDYKTEGEYEYLTVFMQTSYNDYIIREDTKQVVKGDPNTRYDINYRARFMRSLGVTTSENSNASTTKCPNCGAPVDDNAAGQCAYCDTVITNGQHDWVLCNLDDVR